MRTTAATVSRLRFLIDANVFVAVEPYAGATEAGLQPAARLTRLAAEQGHVLLVHPAVLDDLRQDGNAARRDQHLAAAGKYSVLQEVQVSEALERDAGPSDPGTNDHRDLRLLAAVDAKAAHYLVTEDVRLRRRAARAGLENAVLTIAEAAELLAQHAPRATIPPPMVEELPTYQINTNDPIFGSLRSDYEGFDVWLDRVRGDSENRTCFVIRDETAYAGLALLKLESQPGQSGVPAPSMKVSTFKVDPDHAGSKFGELLLKAIFKSAADRDVASLYVTVFPKYELLIDLFASFGFRHHGEQTALDELVLVKHRAADTEHLSDLDYHVMLGPPALAMRQAAYAVPIEPQWHNQLFPDAPRTPPMQPTLFDLHSRPHPWGNALRKAYLCHSATRRLTSGDVLLFYRSRDRSSVDALGVVESTLVSSDPSEIMTYVGQRTVYSATDIDTMCRRGRAVLAVLFRQDRFIDPPWSLTELLANRVLNGPPQTIVTVAAGGMEWLTRQLAESH